MYPGVLQGGHALKSITDNNIIKGTLKIKSRRVDIFNKHKWTRQFCTVNTALRVVLIFEDAKPPTAKTLARAAFTKHAFSQLLSAHLTRTREEAHATFEELLSPRREKRVRDERRHSRDLTGGMVHATVRHKKRNFTFRKGRKALHLHRHHTGSATTRFQVRFDGGAYAAVADTPQAAKRWVEALRFAGGERMAAVTIQCFWRAMLGRRKLLAAMDKLQRGETLLRSAARVNQAHALAQRGRKLSKAEQEVTARKIALLPRPDDGEAHPGRAAAGAALDAAARRSAEMNALSEEASDAAAAKGKAAFTDRVALEGSLAKRSYSGLSGMLGLWKKRYFVCNHSLGALTYYSSRSRKKLGIGGPVVEILQNTISD